MIKEEFEALFANRMNAAFTGHFKKAFYEWLAEYEKQVNDKTKKLIDELIDTLRFNRQPYYQSKIEALGILKEKL